MKYIGLLLLYMFGPIIIAILFTGTVYAVLYFINSLLGY
jgi:hypothetical protein